LLLFTLEEVVVVVVVVAEIGGLPLFLLRGGFCI